MTEVKRMAIDIETFSSNDIKTGGVYKYVEADDFCITLFAYKIDDQTSGLVDLTCDELPDDVWQLLIDPKVCKTAYNANFERTCLAKHFKREFPPEQWSCTAVLAAKCGLPGSLKDVALALNFNQEEQKIDGWRLINYFCIPCKPTKVNGGRTRNLPEHDPEKWELFKEYCLRDVEVEVAVRKKLEWQYKEVSAEYDLWNLDQKINDKGILIDETFVENAIALYETHVDKLSNEMIQITGIKNPDSLGQLKDWFLKAEGIQIKSLTKQTIPELIATAPSDRAKKVLEMRQQLSKTSVKKYRAMQSAICRDGSVKGTLQFYGANRTGRWAGRNIQIHNLPQNKMDDLDYARELIVKKDFEKFDMVFDDVSDILSQLVRTALVPRKKHFLVVDFSAIEARILAWLADENWRLEVFKTHGKIYESSAEKMFSLPAGSVTKGSPERQKGKIAELALGYGGSKAALEIMGALSMGLTEEELPGLVNQWRNANPNIVGFWKEINRCAMKSILNGESVLLNKNICCHYEKDSTFFFITLPSGRDLSYAYPRVDYDELGREQIFYAGTDAKKWTTDLRTYGGKLTENIVQAIARDCLAEALLLADKKGFEIVAHVHDEIIVEHDDKECLSELESILSEPLSWAEGLPLQGEGFYCNYYRKD